MAEPHVAMSHFHLVRSPLSANYVLKINHMTELLQVRMHYSGVSSQLCCKN